MGVRVLPPNHCTCPACERKRIYQYNRHWKMNGRPDKVKPVPPYASFVGCDCVYCVKHVESQRQAAKRYRVRRRVEILREREEAQWTKGRTESDHNFEPGAYYEWDKTTLDDYGLNAQARILRRGLTDPIVARSPVLVVANVLNALATLQQQQSNPTQTSPGHPLSPTAYSTGFEQVSEECA